MDIKLNNKKFFIFDLDDTLYAEIDYLKSAYKEIANYLKPLIGIDVYDEMLDSYIAGENVFLCLINRYKNVNISLEILLSIYRNHMPAIKLRDDALSFLKGIEENIPIGLITDGRSVTQRNKLKALGIENLFCEIIISEEFGSEKPNPRNYCFYVDKYPGYEFVFFGDNLNKDFIIPKSLGWRSFCLLDRGVNIHKQENVSEYEWICFIDSFDEINLI